MPRKSAIANSSANDSAVYTSCLTISKMRLAVKLGYEKEERRARQPVEVDIQFFFPTLIEASFKDKGDFICYDKISHLVEKLCTKKEFRLIEFLGTEIYRAVRAVTAPEIKIAVKPTKCQVPIEFILGGASYAYSDLPPFSWVAPH